MNRTKKALRRALLELMTERGYEVIGIQDIVDRADVGRSTFYAHYADKDDLLVENMAALGDYLRMKMADAQEAVPHPALAFSLPMLEHMDEARMMFRGLLGPKRSRVVHVFFNDILCELVRERLGTQELPQGVVVQFLVAGFMAVARWWIIESPKSSVAQVQEIYLRLVSQTLV